MIKSLSLSIAVAVAGVTLLPFAIFGATPFCCSLLTTPTRADEAPARDAVPTRDAEAMPRRDADGCPARLGREMGRALILLFQKAESRKKIFFFQFAFQFFSQLPDAFLFFFLFKPMCFFSFILDCQISFLNQVQLSHFFPYLHISVFRYGNNFSFSDNVSIQFQI